MGSGSPVGKYGVIALPLVDGPGQAAHALTPSIPRLYVLSQWSRPSAWHPGRH